MSWEVGNQERRAGYSSDINNLILDKEGFLEEQEAKLLLYQFLKGNTTFAVDLLSGVKLFPFQHMAIKSMLESDYFLGIWSRGMSKSFTTGIFAFLDAVLNQGVQTGIISKSFRQAKMIFKKIEDIATLFLLKIDWVSPQTLPCILFISNSLIVQGLKILRGERNLGRAKYLLV